LDEVGEWIVVTELGEVFAVIHISVVSYSTWIGDENVPMHWFSSSSGSEDVWFLVLDGEVDEGEGSEPFIGGEVSCVKGEKVE
jgi:hypothetical protein